MQAMYEFGADRYECKRLCSFGLISAPLAAFLATDVGLGAGLGGAVATGLTGAATGAGIGALGSAITGGNIEKGALLGAGTGGVLGGVGGPLAEAVGGGTAGTLAETGLGAATGAGLAAAEGMSPLTGALSGGSAGLISSGLGGATGPAEATPTPTASTASASPMGASPGTSAAATSLPGGVGGTPSSLDLASAGGLGSTSNPAFMGALTESPTAGGAGSINGVSPAADNGSSFFMGSSVLPTDSGLAATSAAAPPGGPSSGLNTFLDRAVDQITKNPLALLSGGGLLLASHNQTPINQLPEAKPLEQSAGQTGALGANLTSYLNTGTLPPGAQTAVDQATAAAKAGERSTFGRLGLGGSTMEAQALGAVDRQAAAQKFQIADQLLSQGAKFTDISNQLYQQLLNETLQQDEAFQRALGSFAGGLAGAGTRTA